MNQDGIDDNYRAGPTEPVNLPPDSDLVEYGDLNGLTVADHFDDLSTDGSFLHVFVIDPLPESICGAWLEMRIRSSGSGHPCNDTVNLALEDGFASLPSRFDFPPTGEPWFKWGRFIGTVDDGPKATARCRTPGGDIGLIGRDWDRGQAAKIILDLSKLDTPGRSQSVNLLPELEVGTLDVVVSDDTSVDFIQLRILPCSCS